MFRFRIILIFCCISGFLSAQNLLDDSKNLLQALRTMQDSAASPIQREDAAKEALLILFLYDQPTQLDPPRYLDAGWLSRRIKRNTLLQGFITPMQDSVFRAIGTVDATQTPFWSQIQTPQRYQISSMMYRDAAISPSKYLSMRQSMQNTQIPALQNETAMRVVADKVKSANVLNTEAIIQGLFDFILERAQQEVAVSFFENLLDKKVPQVGYLFPNVRARYANPDITYSQSFLEGLREAFYLDLKNLNITLPELLLQDEFFGGLRQDPIFYNLLTVYSIFGLAQGKDSVSLSEVFPLVHRNLYDSYETAAQNLNAALAEKSDSSEAYQKVIATVSQFTAGLKEAYLDLDDAETQIESKISALQQSHEDAPPPPDRSQFLANPLYSYEVLIGNTDTTAAGFNINLLPQFLRGRLDSATLAENNTFEFYDKFFDKPTSSLNWRIAGLELTRNLNGTWYNDLGITDILRRWTADLTAYQQAVTAWQASFDTLSIEEQIQQSENERQALQQMIAELRVYWSDKTESASLQPLIVLESIASDFSDIDFGGHEPAQTLVLRRERLLQIEKRLGTWEQRVSEPEPFLAVGSPLRKYLTRNENIQPGDKVKAKVAVLDDVLQQLQLDLRQLDNLEAPSLKKAWSNTRPMLQTTEFMSHLLYAVQGPNGLMRLSALDSALFDPTLRQVAMGLLQQRLSKVKDVGFVSPDAMAQFTRLTLEGLLNLQKMQTDSSANAPDSQQKLFSVLGVALQSINRLLEFPLFANPKKPLDYQSLTDRMPSLRPLPDISERCMNFLYHLENREYRSAISSLMRLMTTLSKILDKTDESEQRARLLNFFEEYGDFVAGLVDAQSKEQVEYLLKSLADPPGSSRTKRTHSITVGINAYVGASFGQENWDRNTLSGQVLQSDFAVAAPSMPVGFAISKLLGASWKHPQSFSLFVSLLDLGALMTYRLEKEDTFGEYKMTYKNVFKPGLQLHWNIQRTPFYLGAGWQTGAQFRQIDDREISFRSSRYFLAFGVDVPIKTLYRH
ncbi:MAG: hypothetical protein LCH81_15615 [Bacteroidetes bacterium]|nr:hypothetical protein [Bacteroidota bacterium]